MIIYVYRKMKLTRIIRSPLMRKQGDAPFSEHVPYIFFKAMEAHLHHN